LTIRIRLKADKLDDEARRFTPIALTAPFFLNSVPKSGTHLLRNIVRMFTAPEAHYRGDAVQLATLHHHRAAFASEAKLASWGHLFFSDESAIALRDVRHVLLVRDPYDWVLASARFFLSDQAQGPLSTIKNGAPHVEDVLNLMIFGAFDKQPSLRDGFEMNAAAWLGTKAHLVRYEDIRRHVAALESAEAERYFAALLAACGIAKLPADWRERVRIGADPKHSGTARENLTGLAALPETLPDAQKRLVDFHAPGLRAMLGY
jgi:hypothetical protein